MWASAPTHFCCSASAERLFPSSPPCQRSKISGAGVDFIALNPYNKMEYEYGLLIRCSRLPQTPFWGQAAVQKKRGQTPRDRHCERKNVSEAAFAAGRKLRHCRICFCEKVRCGRGAVTAPWRESGELHRPGPLQRAHSPYAGRAQKHADFPTAVGRSAFCCVKSAGIRGCPALFQSCQPPRLTP